LLATRIEASLRRAQHEPALAPLAREIAELLPDVQAAVQTVSMLAGSDIDLALANASLFLDALGHLVVAWLWLDIALSPRADDGLRRAARYFIEWELPPKRHALKLVARADRAAFDMPDAAF
jgi:butyryl-CoA dehydrogenase